MKAIGAVIVASLILVIFYDYSVNQRLTFLGFQSVNIAVDHTHTPIPYGQAFSSLGVMLMGIVFSSLYDRIRDVQGKIKIGAEIRAVFSSAQLYRSLLVSPLVFAGVYAASGKQPDIAVASLFAFQNGFFCHSIFLNKRKPITP